MSNDKWIVHKINSSEYQFESDKLQELFHQANSFYLAGTRCATDIKVSPRTTSYLPIPAVVCFTLSLELYIKLILQLSTQKYPYEHNLISLIRQIPEHDMVDLCETLGLSKENLIEKIYPIAVAFVKWRYVHEESSLTGCPEEIQIICEGFYSFIIAKEPILDKRMYLR